MLARYIFAPALLLSDAVILAALINVFAMARGVTPWGEFVGAGVLGPAFILVVAIYLIDGYRLRTDMLSLEFASLHVIALLAATVVTLLATFVFAPPGFSLQQSRITLALAFATAWPLGLGIRRIAYQASRRSLPARRILFLGQPTDAQDFIAECRRTHLPVEVITAAITPAPTADAADYRAVIDRLATGTEHVEAIVLRESSRDLPDAVVQQLQALYFAGIPTYTLELFHQLYWRKIPLYRINDTWLFQAGFKIAREPVYDRLKRTSDILLALIGLVLSAPLVAAAALAIAITDGRPVFFTQARLGRHRIPFQLLKLRTMRATAGPALSDPRYTQTDDPRVTPIGRFLRTSRIDEFPQLWNVLRGDMSLIGPRAEWTALVTDYERTIPCYHFRHLVRPGITGWAQVNYPYGATIDDTLRKLEYDLYYIRHFSFRMDASIILKTIHVMLFGKGR